MLKTKRKNKKKKSEKQTKDNEYEDMESEDIATCSNGAKVYLPGNSLDEDEELVREESAYEMFHEAQTGKYV